MSNAVHVEAVVGQCEGGFKVDTLYETKFVMDNLKSIEKRINLVAFVQLSLYVLYFFLYLVSTYLSQFYLIDLMLKILSKDIS